MSEPARQIGCRFCDYKVLPMRTLANGKVRSGMQSIKNHIELNHPDEYEKIYGIEEGL